MSRSLIAIIEFELEGETRTYNVYEATPTQLDKGRLCVTSDYYVGHWDTLDEVRDFITHYLRCTSAISIIHTDGVLEIFGPLSPLT